MASQHEISEYIDNLPLQKTFCKGYRVDEVYEVICNICSMYNQLLSESYTEIDILKQQLDCFESSSMLMKRQTCEEKEEFENVNPEELAINKMELLTEKENEEMSCGYENMKDVNADSVMSDKEIQRLKRGELLEILLDQSRENEALRIEIEEKNQLIEELNLKLSNREIDLKQAGTIAEASFKLNGVFEAAENAAKQYLENLQVLYEKEKYLSSKKEMEIESRCSLLLQAAKERCDFMKEETLKKCEEMETRVRKQCEDLMFATEMKCKNREKESEEKCLILDQKAKTDVDQRWNDLSKRLEDFYNAHEGLKDLLASSKML